MARESPRLVVHPAEGGRSHSVVPSDAQGGDEVQAGQLLNSRSLNSRMRQRRKLYWPREKYLDDGPPESVGAIKLMGDGRFVALAPRDERGRRRAIGAFETPARADEKLAAFRRTLRKERV